MKTLAKILSTFFGVGFFPLAPGTAASSAVVLLYYFFLWPLPWPWLAGIILVCFAAGVPASARYAVELGRTDPRTVVIDEVCGQLIALFLIPFDRAALLLSFLLFRLFDVVKPWPIRRLEKFPGGWGIMADDVAAGLLARLCLQIYIFLR
jgi:phosphatidylglycerophosphatase A